MKKIVMLLVFIALCTVSIVAEGKAEDLDQNDSPIINSDELIVLWTSGDRDIALNTVFMYCISSKSFGWWDEITLIVWGPSSKLLSEDEELQKHIKKMLDMGIVIKACKACADKYEVADDIAGLGIEVKYMSYELTQHIKDKDNLITF